MDGVYLSIPSEEYVELLEIKERYNKERKRGRWKIIDDTEFRVPGWYCSLCNYQISDRYGKYNYCPSCGAEME